MAKSEFSEREIMKMAIDVMKDSRNEPRPDGKIPPKVGAVLLFPDGRIEKAYRGELREGDHAEYTLLERKLVNENLEGCILFTTLEPCAKRNQPKVPCCRRTTNARIKKVFVGIEDPDPTVDGKGIKHLENHGVEVKMFDRDLQRIIEDENSGFIKYVEYNKKKEKRKVEDLQSPIEKPIENYDLNKLNNDALKYFIKLADLTYDVNESSFWDYLVDFGALEWDSVAKKYIPTGYGILLFGKDPRAKFPNAVLKAHVTYGSGDIESRDFSGPLVLMPDQIQDWLKKVLPLAKDTSQFKRVDIAGFPIPVLREAIVNALVHRDYEIKEAKCELKIDDDKIVVNSPGKPLAAISLEDLNSFDAPSLSRNPIITYVFSLMEYVEEKGFGMKTFKSLNEEYGLPMPKYLYREPFLTLVFPRNQQGVKTLLEKTLLQSLNEDDLKKFEIFRRNEPVSKIAFAKYARISDRSAERFLKEWTELGLLKRIGAGPSTTYMISEK